MKLRQFWNIAKQSVMAWIDDGASSMGAAIAFYTVFSIAPLLVIVIAVAGAVWGREAVQGEIVGQIADVIGRDAAITVQGLLQSAAVSGNSLMATVLGVGALLIGATRAFAELQTALDKIWRVPPEAISGFWHTIKTRLLSFGIIFAFAFLLIVSLVASAGLAAIGQLTRAVLPAGAELLLQCLNLVISLSITTVLFASIYKLMPQVRIAWRDVWVGGAVTAVLFEIGKLLIGLYLGKSAVVSSFGAAGSLAVLLLWINYSAQIFLLGAEFTWVFASQHGSKVHEPQPEPGPNQEQVAAT